MSQRRIGGGQLVHDKGVIAQISQRAHYGLSPSRAGFTAQPHPAALDRKADRRTDELGAARQAGTNLPGQLMWLPRIASSAGRNEIDIRMALETTMRPLMPTDRVSGSGTMSSAARPTITVALLPCRGSRR